MSGTRTEHRRVVLGEDLILGPVGKHVDEIVQVPQTVSQGSDGEIPRGEWLQIPQVTVSCEKAELILTTHRPQEEDRSCRAGGQACRDIQVKACTATPPLLSAQGKEVTTGEQIPTSLGQDKEGLAQQFWRLWGVVMLGSPKRKTKERDWVFEQHSTQPSKLSSHLSHWTPSKDTGLMENGNEEMTDRATGAGMWIMQGTHESQTSRQW